MTKLVILNLYVMKEKDSNIFVNIVQTGIEIDEFLFEFCKLLLIF